MCVCVCADRQEEKILMGGERGKERERQVGMEKDEGKEIYGKKCMGI